MSKINSFYKNRGPISVILSIILSVLFVVTVVQAATTIGSNITTDGTINVNGLTTLGQASSTLLSVYNGAYFGGTATSSFSSTGDLTLTTASSTGTVKFAVINSDSGEISFGNENLTTTGAVNFATASSTGLATLDSIKISSTGDTIADIQFGTCTVTFGSITASSTAVTDCTATGVTTSYEVFVTPNITDNGIFMVSASSTSDNTIQIAVHNVGHTGDLNPADNVWSWMAIK